MTGIFVSYRREDAAGHAGRLFDRLRARFGQSVFMDVSGIEPGVDFVEAIDRAVGSCDVLLAVIGREWLGCRDAGGRRRLEDPNDFIRIEVVRALARGVRVVPVLVEGAAMPPPDALPSDLQPLSRRQAAELRDTRWDADVDDLIDLLANVAPARRAAAVPPRPAATPGTRRARWPWVVAAAGLVVGVVAFMVAKAPFSPQPYPQPTTPATAALEPGPGPRPGDPPVLPPTRRMEVLIGMPLEYARTTLAAAGLETRVTYEETREARPDVVLRQVPGPEEEIPADLLMVELIVAREPAAPTPAEVVQRGGAGGPAAGAKRKLERGRVGPAASPRLALAEVGPSVDITYADDADAVAAQKLAELLRRSDVPVANVFRGSGAAEWPGTVLHGREEHRELAERVAQQSRGYLSRLYGGRVSIEVRLDPNVPAGTVVLNLPPGPR